MLAAPGEFAPLSGSLQEQAPEPKEHAVGKVIAQASMSLDGYIAKDDNTIGRLFDWLQNGEVAVRSPADDLTVHLTPHSVCFCQPPVL